MRSIAPTGAWARDALLPALPQTAGLEIYDLRASSPDILLSVSTLVGLVNRGQAKIYVIENTDDEFWLQQLDPALPCTRPVGAGEDVLAHLLRMYGEQVAGLVIYDPNLLDTRNVASTLAALRAGLVVSPELANRLQAAPYHLPVLADLRVHGWKSRVQAYAWAYKHVLPECSPDLLAGLDPRICGSLRSFLVTQRVFTCWLDARKIVPMPEAGWQCERGLFKRLLASFQPGALHLGWFVSEPFSIRLTSRAAMLTLASDHCTNLAIWSSLPGVHAGANAQNSSVASLAGEASTSDEQLSVAASVPARVLVENERAFSEAYPSQETAKEPFDANAIYLSFTISDGDNLQYCQHRLLHLWRDPARGSVPLGWTIAPALWQTMPRLAEFYHQTATENDVLIAGPSGVAYMLPSYWPRRHRAAFLQMTADSLRAMDLTLLQVLDSWTWLSWFSMKFLNPGLQELFARQLAAHGLRGILSGAGGLFPSWRLRAGVPVYQNLGLALNPQRAQSLIQSAVARKTRFINIYVFAWTTNPGDLQRIVQQLDSNVRVVTPARLLELIQQRKQI
ncbi:MAG TPA: GxGYxYP domain-containing protein [Ktedonobacteraceae bacterium]|nr:GxGYxYP domain-containing protein [Ktedonobacteraceae bacterium]